MAWFRRERGERATTRLFFASDLHGSTPAFRKFVNAARVFDVDALVFGGDLMGKALVPILAGPSGTLRAEFQGVPYELSAEDLDGFARSVEAAGFYWKVMEPDEHRALGDDPAALAELFDRLARERLGAWIAFAEERLPGEVRCYLTGGNDDSPAVLSVLEEARGAHVVACEHRVIDLDGVHSMITVGYSTPTPWRTAREASEEEIAAAIDASMRGVPDPSRCVFNLHVPPVDSGLDTCLRLVEADGELPTPAKDQGRPVWFGAGSRAVREAIRTYQPVVGLHGHIHESPGQRRYGRTRCFNPGSEYGQGILRGMVLSLRDGEVVGYQLVSG